MKRAAVFVLALGACGPGRWWEVKPIIGPDGSNQWVVARCRFHADCIEALGRSCRTGYEITQDIERPKDNSVTAHCKPPKRAE